MFSPTTAAIRFGYGLSPRQSAPSGSDAMLTALAAPDAIAGTFPIAGFGAVLPMMREFRASRKARNAKETGAEDRYKAARGALRGTALDGMRAQLARAVLAPDGFRERLWAFWDDHFTVRAKGGANIASPSAFAEEAIRPHIGGNFRDMLRAATTHPAMLSYLDQNRSIGPDSPAGKRRDAGINENLARELMELHTLGVDGGYTQEDVVQLSELLTGLTIDPKVGFRFRPAWAEPGAETVLGRVYGRERKPRLSDIFDALDDIAAQPATAAHLARQLAVHFVSDTPDDDLVAQMTAAYRESDGDLPTVYAAMLDHPAAWALPAVKTRQPWDFIAAALRALDVPAKRFAAARAQQLRAHVLRPLARMGQPWQQPPGPDGWPEDGAAWISPPALAERIDWAMQVHELTRAPLPDPRRFLTTALAERADDTLGHAVRAAASRAAGVGLVLASPAFNRR